MTQYQQNAYNNPRTYAGRGSFGGAAQGVWQPPKKKNLWWLWVLIGLVVLALIGVLIYGLSQRGTDRGGAAAETGPYVGVLDVTGTMMVESAPQNPLLGTDGEYDQEFLLDAVEEMMNDPLNRGILLYLDTPGGEVMAADELGRALDMYKEETGRPVYSYGYSYAASGGYWVGCVADKFYLNRYCITGSIGVTMGSMIDYSGLLEKYGVKAYTLASGDQKAAGSGLTPVDQETLDIYQGIINEYFLDFLNWVADHRKQLNYDQVLALADGRIYTARQAVANGLADEVGEYGDALSALLEEAGEDCAVREFYPPTSFFSFLDLLGMGRDDELSTLLGLLPPSGILAYYQMD